MIQRVRRLIFIPAAGVLAAGTVLTAGVASAGATAVRQTGCTPSGSAYWQFTSSTGVNYYFGTPNNTYSGATVRLKPLLNGTTSWAGSQCSNGTWLVTNRGLALTSRARNAGADVAAETPGAGGSGFASQHWTVTFTSTSSGTTATFRNQLTGLYLRIPNSGPVMGQTVTTGNSATPWKLIH